MAKDQQEIFIEKWISRGKETTDSFDKFFSLWIALIIAAQRVRRIGGRRFPEDDNDRKRILDYVESNKDDPANIMSEWKWALPNDINNLSVL